MPQVRTGVYPSGPNKGRRWEIYPEPSSSTGWTIKIIDPYRPDKPYYGEFNAAAADVDEQTASGQRATQAAAEARNAGVAQQQEADDTAAYNSALRYRDSRNQVADTQWDRTFQSGESERQFRRQQALEAVKEQRRQHNLSYGLDVRAANRADASLGNDILKTGASMRGALNWAQGDSYSQGISAGGLSPFVTALGGGGMVPYGGGTATQGNPTPLTVGTLANAMGGGGGGSSSRGAYDQYGRPRLSASVQAGVDAAGKVYQGGLANQGLGFMENMSDDQQDAFTSAGDWLGRNTRSEQQYYKRSRPGQRSALRG